MEIIMLKPEQRQAFLPLLPEKIAEQLNTQPEVLAFGAVVDRVPQGILVFSLEDTQVRILWLCTAEKVRGQGIGRRLIRALGEKALADPEATRLIADVPRGPRLDPLYLLLLSECWMPTPFHLPVYSFTVGEAAGQDFWRQEMELSGIQPIAELPKSMVREYSADLEEGEAGNAVSLPLNLSQYDPTLSLGYVIGGKLHGIVLFVREGDELVLRYAHALVDAPLAFAKLVYAAGRQAIAQEPPETRISLAALGSAGQRLIEKLLPGCAAQPMYRMCLRLSLMKEAIDHV